MAEVKRPRKATKKVINKVQSPPKVKHEQTVEEKQKEAPAVEVHEVTMAIPLNKDGMVDLGDGVVATPEVLKKALDEFKDTKVPAKLPEPPQKPVFECPFCGNQQTEGHNSDMTSANCEKCGKVYHKYWKQEKKERENADIKRSNA